MRLLLFAKLYCVSVFFKSILRTVWKNLNLHPARSITTITDDFFDKIICAKCGNTYHRVNSGNCWVYWYCMGKKKKAVRCDNINYTDYQLRQISAFILGEDEFNANTFNKRVKNSTPNRSIRN